LSDLASNVSETKSNHKPRSNSFLGYERGILQPRRLHRRFRRILRSFCAREGHALRPETVTFAFPDAFVACSPVPVVGGWPMFSPNTVPHHWSTLGFSESYILFLRHSQGSETQLTPDLWNMQGPAPSKSPSCRFQGS
jgi:hypothetical protein